MLSFHCAVWYVSALPRPARVWHTEANWLSCASPFLLPLTKVVGGSTAVLSLPATSTWLCTDEGEEKCLFLEGKVLLLLLHFRPSFSTAITLTGAMIGTELCQQPASVLPLSFLLHLFQYAHLQMFHCVDLSDVCGVGILYLVVNGILSLHHDADVPSFLF